MLLRNLCLTMFGYWATDHFIGSLLLQLRQAGITLIFLPNNY